MKNWLACKSSLLTLIKIFAVNKSVTGLPIELTESLYHACICYILIGNRIVAGLSRRIATAL